MTGTQLKVTSIILIVNVLSEFLLIMPAET